MEWIITKRLGASNEIDALTASLGSLGSEKED